MSKSEWTSEGLLTQTNEIILPRTKHFLWRELFITHIKRIFTEIERADRNIWTRCNFNSNGKSRSTSWVLIEIKCWTENALTSLKQNTSATWARIVLRLSFKLEVEKWRLTHRDFLNQCSPTVSARSLKLTTFSKTKHLFFLMCSCFLDAAQTLLRSSQPTWTFLRFHSFPSFFEENFVGGTTKGRQIWIVLWMQTTNSEKRLRCRWLATLQRVKTAMRYSDWLHKLAFSHVKTKRIDFYK